MSFPLDVIAAVRVGSGFEFSHPIATVFIKLYEYMYVGDFTPEEWYRELLLVGLLWGVYRK